jgi:thioredoxin
MKIIDFYADWCQPCKQMKPTIESLEKDFDVEKIDIDAQSDVAQAHGVMSIPTLIVFKDDKEVKRFTGVTSESDIRGLLTQLAE